MNKIEEILNNNRDKNPRDHASEWNEYNVISSMKEYAELCEMELLARIRNKMRKYVSEEILDIIVDTPLMSSDHE